MEEITYVITGNLFQEYYLTIYKTIPSLLQKFPFTYEKELYLLMPLTDVILSGIPSFSRITYTKAPTFLSTLPAVIFENSSLPELSISTKSLYFLHKIMLYILVL